MNASTKFYDFWHIYQLHNAENEIIMSTLIHQRALQT